MTPPRFNTRGASRHRLLRQLGHGNLTRVFLATPARPGPSRELVVLKLMHPELAQDDDFRALFLDQAARALALRHHNLVRTIEIIAEPDACGLTMEFLQGQTLARLIERIGRLRLPVDLHLHILSQVLAALDHAHRFARPRTEPGFLHRDVCPNNVFITYDGQVKLLGTGLGSAVQALEARLGRPLLDPKYAAPEVLLGHPSGASADVFSAGVMVWEALTRQARIGSDDPKVVVRRRTGGEELDLESAWPDASQPLVALCARALAMNPGERYPAALDFRADLDAYLSRSAESSAAVLGRLPELMQASFGAEREQMQLFIGACLGAIDQDTSAVAPPVRAVDELAPHDLEWPVKVSNGSSSDERDELDAGFRTGLRRAKPEPPLHRETGVYETGLLDEAHPAEVQPPRAPVQPLPPRPLQRSAQPATEPPPKVAARVPLPPRRLAPSQQEPTTSGHRAYTSTLHAGIRAHRSALRPSPDVLGALALLLGSVVAVYSFYRHAQSERRPESQKLASLTEAHRRPSSSSSAAPERSLAARPAAGAPPVPAKRGLAAGSPSLEPEGPAFFDGRATAPLGVPAALRADELPAVDPALRTLQDAIVTAARAHRSAVERRRARKAESTLRTTSSVLAAPRSPGEATDPEEREH